MMRRYIFAVAAGSAILFPLAVLARNFDFEYRMCVRDAMNRRENSAIENTVNHHQNRLNAFFEHRSRLFMAWDIGNDKDRNNAIRAADKDFRDILRFHDKNYKAILRDLEKVFRFEEKNCRNDFNNRVRQVPVGAMCFSSDECHPPLGYCTVDTGECRQTCRPGSDPCENMCSGKCKLR